MINYSIVIPHHNSPSLLARCLDSIPMRGDIEIIVVDDNSDDDKRPCIQRDNIKMFHIDAQHTTGPGGARNLGMAQSKGKWILFADCDDYYTDGFLEILDKYKESDLDLLFYGIYFEKASFHKKNYETALEQYEKNNNEYNLRVVKHILQVPWNFMVKRDFVEKTGVKFGTGYMGEDAIFHHKIAMLANKCEAVKQIIYVWTYNEGSLTKRKYPDDFLLKFLLPRSIEIIKILIEAKAWFCIKPFYHGFFSNKEKYGTRNAFIFVIKRLFMLPWLKIWWHKHLKMK